ncbi:recombinase family protein [Lentibacillus sp. CBA3610]|uniref:recombinase family protein n=1 Tax=Lentibacillus sp. CBA3610 TaxID=2518176 RepID=UPI001594EC00|nr:recombinase family protein [Lentibacillus sp. CBA3610]QKY69684.1 hypothetical protein Len3610_08815 [Lentibacillus sp. CBA3610]
MEGLMDRLEKIKFVAVYLRKSRSMGDTEEDLIKHRKAILDTCEENGWSFVEYPEVISGDTIEARPKMRELLIDIENNSYDAVFAFDTDRLGRGGSGDQERIALTLKHTETYFITANPFKIYDLNNESDDQFFDMQSFMGRFEYKQINKRLQAGKKTGLKMGRWSHGSKPPFGYDRNHKLKKLTINEDEKETIRMIVDYFLEGMTLSDIAWELNKRKIPSPRGLQWRAATISRLLKSEVYLGYVIGNKTEGTRNRLKSSSSKPFKELPREKWIIVKNSHKPIISEEEHEQIMDRFSKSPKKVYNNQIYSLTGLVTCGKCNKRMSLKRLNSGDMSVQKCECGNHSGNIKIIEDAIYQTALALKDKLNEIRTDNIVKQKEDKMQKKLDDKIKELDKQDHAIERIEEAFENGLYDIQKTRKKTQERQEEKWRLEKEISDTKKQMTSMDSLNNKERVTVIDKFINEVSKDINHEEKNKLYKEMICSITWTKDDLKEVVISVNFL